MLKTAFLACVTRRVLLHENVKLNLQRAYPFQKRKALYLHVTSR